MKIFLYSASNWSSSELLLVSNRCLHTCTCFSFSTSFPEKAWVLISWLIVHSSIFKKSQSTICKGRSKGKWNQGPGSKVKRLNCDTTGRPEVEVLIWCWDPGLYSGICVVASALISLWSSAVHKLANERGRQWPWQKQLWCIPWFQLSSIPVAPARDLPQSVFEGM